MTATLSKTGKNKLSALKEKADFIRSCQDEVLKQWEQGQDRLGRSTAWKAQAAREDIKNKVSESSIMEALAKEIILMMEKKM